MIDGAKFQRMEGRMKGIKISGIIILQKDKVILPLRQDKRGIYMYSTRKKSKVKGKRIK